MPNKKDKKNKDSGGKHNPKKYIDLEPSYESVTDIALNYLEERAPLSMAQRKRKAMTMRRYKNKIAMARKRAAKRKATPEKLKARAQRKSRNIIKQRLMKSKKYSEMSAAEKIALDKRIQRIPKAALERLTRRQLPQVKKAERERLANRGGKKEDYEFDILVYEINESTKQDQDIEDKKGTQPAKYYKGLAPSTKDKRDAHFNKKAKMDDDNPDAYKPAPGDKEAKTKPSKHTKKYDKMFGEDVQIENLIEQIELMEEKAEKALKKKSKETGISYSILKKVFDRGVAAWRTGHRPGTTPVQWGLARVNSFATKGKGTWGKADKDLADKVKKNESLEEDNPCWDGYKKVRGKKDYEPGSCVKEDIFTLEEIYDMDFLDEESIVDKALSAMHRHVLKGVDVGDIAYDISKLVSGIKLTGKQLEKEYIKKYGPPQKAKKKHDPKIMDKFRRKYGVAESSDPYDREWGTDSLTRIYKKDTPGQHESSPLEKEMPRGSRVRFKKYKITDGYKDVEGTFVGTDEATGRMRIRDDEGKLYVVKHQNVKII